MNSPKFSEDVRSITDLKLRASEVLDHVCRSRRPVLLTRRGRAVAILLDLDVFERLVDRADFVEGVEAGARAAASGDVHPNKKAMKILDSFGE